jgi:hypothetical protein
MYLHVLANFEGIQMQFPLDSAETLAPVFIRALPKTANRGVKKGNGRVCKLAGVASAVADQQKEGMSLREIARYWNTSTSTVLRALAIAANPKPADQLDV